MKILSIETSCDETAVAILEGVGTDKSATFTLCGNALFSQIHIHAAYGGVFPALAKRAHAEHILPLLTDALAQAHLFTSEPQNLTEQLRQEISTTLAREPGLSETFLTFIQNTKRPDIDAIAVTYGPGLEPALWVGVNVARALSVAWHIPIVPINHMEGHLLASLAQHKDGVMNIEKVAMPVLALLISGGHTELEVMDEWLSYRLLGATRDDAVGEAFDKVARMLDLPYPGGPQISRLAELARLNLAGKLDSSMPTPEQGSTSLRLPRPMIGSHDYDFSFSGIKTAVLYQLKARGQLTDNEKQDVAREFENAVSEVMWDKSSRALTETGARTFVIGGGVSANHHIQTFFADNIQREHPNVTFLIPSRELTTDNAVMIGIAGFYHALRKHYIDPYALRANGNLRLAPHQEAK